MPREPASEPDDSVVEIVLPTFGRPDALASAMRSVSLQTWTHWRLLVLGDACGPDTAQAVAPFLADPRVRWVNLPRRCGEQALLNSAGMALAGGRRVAFLNHDDVWLPDHLQTALTALAGDDGLGLFIGRSLWAAAAPTPPGQAPRFDVVSPLGRSFADVYCHGFETIEPVSAWVLGGRVFAAAGPWRRAVDLYRVPIQEWLLRALRAGARLVESPVVGCLKFQAHWGAHAPARNYDTPAHAQQWCVDALSRPEGRRDLLALVAEAARRLDGRLPPRFLQGVPYADEALRRAAVEVLDEAHAQAYRQTGVDAFDALCECHGIVRGQRWRASLQRRTGEVGLEPPTFDEVLAAVRGLPAAGA